MIIYQYVYFVYPVLSLPQPSSTLQYSDHSIDACLYAPHISGLGNTCSGQLIFEQCSCLDWPSSQLQQSTKALDCVAFVTYDRFSNESQTLRGVKNDYQLKILISPAVITIERHQAQLSGAHRYTLIHPPTLEGW